MGIDHSRPARLRTFGAHVLLLLLAVVIYNRVLHYTHSASGHWIAPFYAFYSRPSVSWEMAGRWGIAIVIAIVWIGLVLAWLKRPPSFAARLRMSLAFVLLVNCTTAMTDSGLASLWWPLDRLHDEIYPDAVHVRDPTEMLRTYPTPNLSGHSKTHPPGAILFLWFGQRFIAAGPMAAALELILVTALTIIPAALLARRWLDDTAMTLFLALYVLTPNLVIFGATSMDGVYACFLNWTAYFFFTALDATRGTIPRAIHLGLWLAISTFLTYASVALVAVMLLWSAWQGWCDRGKIRRSMVLLTIAAVTLLACFVLLYLLSGCNLLSCVRASIAWDADSLRDVRTHRLDVIFTNLFGFIAGSGLIASTLWLREVANDRGTPCARQPIAATLFLTVVILSVSTLFTRELERVWLFLTPLLLIGAARNMAVVAAGSRQRRIVTGLCLLTVLQTFAMQLLLITIW